MDNNNYETNGLDIYSTTIPKTLKNDEYDIIGEGIIVEQSGYSIFDIANWFLRYSQIMSHKKIQKICYYAEAWHLALYNKKLFNDTNFEAWVHGPVSPELYNSLKGNSFEEITVIEPYNEERILQVNSNINLVDLLQSVWITYGDIGPNALEVLTHSETPWKNARIGLKTNERGNKIISEEDMKKYYREIYIGDDK